MTTASPGTSLMTRFAVPALVVCGLLFAGCRADREPTSFVTEANLSWLDGKMGWDLADHAEWGVGFDADSATAHFADMARMGVSVVRRWLFADCRAGIVFDASGAPTGIQPEVYEWLDFVMDELCPAYGIKMYWCLLSGLLDTSHLNIVTNAAIRRAYIENVLTPLAEGYGEHPSRFAFDLMNEPESDVAGRSGNYRRIGTDWTRCVASSGTVPRRYTPQLPPRECLRGRGGTLPATYRPDCTTVWA